MNINLLTSQKSSSLEAMKKTNILSTLNGGVTQDFSANVENIRDISRKMGTNILPTFGSLRNLVKYSEEFDKPNWQISNVTVSANTITAPDGTLTADSIMEVNNTGSKYITQSIPVTGGIPYTMSIYMKYNGRQWAYVGINSSGDKAAYFDLINGVIGNLVGVGTSSPLIENVGNGWYRCSVVVIPQSSVALTSTACVPSNGAGSTHPGDNTKGYYVWGAQLEQNSNPTAYQPTKELQTNTELLSANFLFVPSSYGEGKVYSQSHSFRNLIKYSEDFTNPVYNKQGGVTIVSSNNLDPLGGNTAQKINCANASLSGIFQNGSMPALGKVFTTSVWLKGDVGGEKIAFDLYSNIDNVGPTITLTTTWQRYFYTTVTYNVNNPAGWQIVNADLTPKSFYMWGAQLEQSSVLSPYQKITDAISDFTFTRATFSTVTNKQGMIEDSCYNLFQRSEEFDNAVWPYGQITLSVNSITSPSNTMTGDKIIADASLNRHWIAQAYATSINTSYTFSCYLKGGEYNFAQIVFTRNGAAAEEGYIVNLSTGAITNIISNGNYTNVNRVVTSVGNGWFIASISANIIGIISNIVGGIALSNTDTGIAYVAGQPSFLGNGVSGIYVWGGQLTQGLTLRPYIKTTNRLNVPKLDYSRTLTEPSLLIEPQRTNLLLQSDNIGAWSYPNSSITPDIIVNPTTGLQNADKQIPSTVDTWHNVYQYLPALTNGTYTFTCYVKNAGYNFAVIGFSRNNGPAEEQFIVNLTSGNISNIVLSASYTNVSRNVVSFPNGWYKVIMTATIGGISAGMTPFIGISNTDTGIIYTANQPSFVGDGASGIYVSSIQLEAGSNATTYIPTTTATVTRNADTCYVDLFNNNMLNQDNFTLLIEGYWYGGGGGTGALGVSETTTLQFNNNIFIYQSGFGYIVGGSQSIVNNAFSNNTSYKVVIQRNGTQVRFFKNGLLIGTATVPVFNYRYIAMQPDGVYAIDKIALFNRTLTDAECINLVSPTNNSFESLASAYTYTLIT